MKTAKKIFSVMLTLAMLLSMLAFPAKAETNGGKAVKVAYIPIDNRPVNYQRVEWLAQSVNIELLMPDEDLFRTALDNMEPNANGSTYGDRRALMNWIKSVDGECDYFVLSLDQMLSGGLVASRWLSNTDLTFEYEVADFIIELSKNNTVVIFDTVMRLASTVNYQGYQMEEYNALRSYGAKERKLLSGSALTVDNIIAGYRNDPYGSKISTSLPESTVTAYLASRARKLKLADYILRNAMTDIDYCYIGVDDSSPGNTIQTNEIAYIRTLIGDKGSCYAATDEFGMMGIARVSCLLYGGADVNVTYYGGGENQIADGYDFETLKVNTETKIKSLGCNIVNSENALQVLIMTKSSSAASAASQLVSQADKNVIDCKPTVIIDPTGSSGGGVLEKTLVDSDVPLAMLFGYSNWNTAGNALGLGLSMGISRYLYLMNSETITMESHEGFLKTMTFAYLKDISYKVMHSDIDTIAVKEQYGYRHLLYEINSSPMFMSIRNTFISKHKTVVCGNYRLPWNRSFEMVFDIDLTDDRITVFDAGNTQPEKQNTYFNYNSNESVLRKNITVSWNKASSGSSKLTVRLYSGYNTSSFTTLIDEATVNGNTQTIPKSSLTAGKWLYISVSNGDGSHNLWLRVVDGLYGVDKGDVNCDGNVSAIDYLMCKRIFLTTYASTEYQNQCADIDGDGKVAANDYLLIKRQIFGSYFIR